MGMKAWHLRRIHSHAPALPGDLREILRQVRAARSRLFTLAHSRAARPRLGMLGLPLALVAALVASQWWAVIPLVACAWWWAPRAWGWEWLVAVGRGLIGAEWAYIGASALAAFPGDRVALGVWWAGVPAAFALVAAVRLRGGRD
jgi:hypothetical protein